MKQAEPLRLERIIPALFVTSFVAPLVLVLGLMAAALLQGQPVDLKSMLAVEAVGVMITGPVVLTLGLPLYLLARRGAWARPAGALAIGGLLGSLVLFVFSESHLTGALAGAPVGAVTGWLFLKLAGESPPGPKGTAQGIRQQARTRSGGQGLQ